jgi:hypothetical protein
MNYRVGMLLKINDIASILQQPHSSDLHIVSACYDSYEIKIVNLRNNTHYASSVRAINGWYEIVSEVLCEI